MAISAAERADAIVKLRAAGIEPTEEAIRDFVERSKAGEPEPAPLWHEVAAADSIAPSELTPAQMDRLGRGLELTGRKDTPEERAKAVDWLNSLPAEERAPILKRFGIRPTAELPAAGAPPDEAGNWMRGAPEFAQALVAVPGSVEGVGRAAGRALGFDLPGGGYTEKASDWLEKQKRATALETGRRLAEAPASIEGVKQVVRAIKDDPAVAADVLGSVAGNLIPFRLATNLLRIVPLMKRHPVVAASLSESGVAAAASVADMAKLDDVTMGELFALGASQGVKTAIITTIGRKVGRRLGTKQFEDVVAGAADPSSQAARATRLQWAGAVLQEAVEEGAEESAQTVIDNLFRDEDPTSGLVASAVLGVGAGGAMGAAAGMFGGRADAPPPDPGVGTDVDMFATQQAAAAIETKEEEDAGDAPQTAEGQAETQAEVEARPVPETEPVTGVEPPPPEPGDPGPAAEAGPELPKPTPQLTWEQEQARDAEFKAAMKGPEAAPPAESGKADEWQAGVKAKQADRRTGEPPPAEPVAAPKPEAEVAPPPPEPVLTPKPKPKPAPKPEPAKAAPKPEPVKPDLPKAEPSKFEPPKVAPATRPVKPPVKWEVKGGGKAKPVTVEQAVKYALGGGAAKPLRYRAGESNLPPHEQEAPPGPRGETDEERKLRTDKLAEAVKRRVEKRRAEPVKPEPEPEPEAAPAEEPEPAPAEPQAPDTGLEQQIIAGVVAANPDVDASVIRSELRGMSRAELAAEVARSGRGFPGGVDPEMPTAVRAWFEGTPEGRRATAREAAAFTDPDLPPPAEPPVRPLAEGEAEARAGREAQRAADAEARREPAAEPTDLADTPSPTIADDAGLAEHRRATAPPKERLDRARADLDLAQDAAKEAGEYARTLQKPAADSAAALKNAGKNATEAQKKQAKADKAELQNARNHARDLSARADKAKKAVTKARRDVDALPAPPAHPSEVQLDPFSRIKHREGEKTEDDVRLRIDRNLAKIASLVPEWRISNWRPREFYTAPTGARLRTRAGRDMDLVRRLDAGERGRLIVADPSASLADAAARAIRANLRFATQTPQTLLAAAELAGRNAEAAAEVMVAKWPEGNSKVKEAEKAKDLIVKANKDSKEAAGRIYKQMELTREAAILGDASPAKPPSDLSSAASNALRWANTAETSSDAALAVLDAPGRPSDAKLTTYARNARNRYMKAAGVLRRMMEERRRRDYAQAVPQEVSDSDIGIDWLHGGVDPGDISADPSLSSRSGVDARGVVEDRPLVARVPDVEPAGGAAEATVLAFGRDATLLEAELDARFRLSQDMPAAYAYGDVEVDALAVSQARGRALDDAALSRRAKRQRDRDDDVQAELEEVARGDKAGVDVEEPGPTGRREFDVDIGAPPVPIDSGKLGKMPANRWNARLAGVLTAWRDPSRKLHVVDGFTRLAWAAEAKKAGADRTQLTVRVLDSKDGWSREQAAAEGLAVNARQGSASPVDLARRIKDGTFSTASTDLDPDSRVLQAAVGLSRLDAALLDKVDASSAETLKMRAGRRASTQETARKVTDRVLREQEAAAQIGHYIPESDRALQETAYDAISKAGAWVDRPAARQIVQDSILGTQDWIALARGRFMGRLARYLRDTPQVRGQLTGSDRSEPDSADAITSRITLLTGVDGPVRTLLTHAESSSLGAPRPEIFAATLSGVDLDAELAAAPRGGLSDLSDAADSTAKGLAALFPLNRLGMGPAFDANDFAKARVHFQNAWNALRRAGRSAADASLEILGRILETAKQFKAESSKWVRGLFKGWETEAGRAVGGALTGRRRGKAGVEDAAATEVWQHDIDPRKPGRRGRVTPGAAREPGAPKPAGRPATVSVEVAEAAVPLQDSLLAAMDKAGQTTAVLPGGVAAGRAFIASGKFPVFLQHQIAHLPGWLNLNAEKYGLKFPRGAELGLLATLRRGVERAGKAAYNMPGADGRKLKNAGVAKQLAAVSEAWIKGRTKPKRHVLEADFLSALINNSNVVRDEAPQIWRALQDLSAKDVNFALALDGLRYRAADDKAKTAMNFVSQLMTAGRAVSDAKQWELVHRREAAAAYAEAHPLEMANMYVRYGVLSKINRLFFDKTGGLRRLEKAVIKAERAGKGDKARVTQHDMDVSAEAAALNYANLTPWQQKRFLPLIEIERKLEDDRPMQEFLLLKRLEQGDPEWDPAMSKEAKAELKKLGDADLRVDWDALAEKEGGVRFDKDKLGPYGISSELAARKLADMKETLPAWQWELLEEAGRRMEEINLEAIDQAVSDGIMSRKQAALLRKSKAYVPFSMVKYADPAYVTPTIHKRDGSTGPVYPVIFSAAHKYSAMRNLGQRNRAMRGVRTLLERSQNHPDALGVMGVDFVKIEGRGHVDRQSKEEGNNLLLTAAGKRDVNERVRENRRRMGMKDVPLLREPELGVLRIYDDGRITDYAVEQSVADAWRTAPDPGMLLNGLQGLSAVSRRLHLTWDPSWIFFANPVMDYLTAALTIHGLNPEGSKTGMLRGSLRLAANWWFSLRSGDYRTARIMEAEALAEGRGKKGRAQFEQIRAGQESNLLGPEVDIDAAHSSALARTGLHVMDAFQREVNPHTGRTVREQIEQRQNDEQMARSNAAVRTLFAAVSPFRTLIRKIDEFTQPHIARLETATKAASMLYAAQEVLALRDGVNASTISAMDERIPDVIRGFDETTKQFIRTTSGSPDYHKTGLWGRQFNAWAQYAPASINSMTAFAMAASDPKTRLGLWTKLSVVSAPVVFNALIRSGYGVDAMRAAAEAAGMDLPEDEEAYPAWLESYRKMLEAVPQYIRRSHYIIPFYSDVHGHSLIQMFPMDHNVRNFIGTLDAAIDAAGRIKDGTAGSATAEAEKFLKETAQLAPGLTWWVGGLGAVREIVTGGNPMDDFRGVPLFMPDEIDGMDLPEKLVRGLTYTASRAGALPFEAVRGSRHQEPEGVLEAALRTPVAGKWLRRFYRYTDGGLWESMDITGSTVRRSEGRRSMSRRKVIEEYAAAAAGGEAVDPQQAAAAYYVDRLQAGEDTEVPTGHRFNLLVADMVIAGFVTPGRQRSLEALRTGSDDEAASKALALYKARVPANDILQAAYIYSAADPQFSQARMARIAAALL